MLNPGSSSLKLAHELLTGRGTIGNDSNIKIAEFAVIRVVGIVRVLATFAKSRTGDTGSDR